MLEGIAAFFRERSRRAHDSDVCGFLCPRDFARHLEIERRRADRTDSVFALLTFTPRDEPFQTRTYQLLGAILPRRLRMTDHFGWFDERRVGVIFPDTPATGAWQVANDICSRFPRGVAAPICAVTTYPSTRPSEAEEPEAVGQAYTSSARFEPMETLFLIKTPLWKRVIDIVGASAGLVILSPLFLLVAAAIKCTSRGPVFYTQLRSGQGGKPFRIYKFRSMVVDAERQKVRLMALNEQDGPAFKVKNDPRVTRLGRFLRTTSIDELPQLWNILRGDMSFVGPRPLPCDETDGCHQWHRLRLDVIPGITCIWQVRGRSSVAFDDWMRMDLEYIHGRSLFRDLSLLVRTIPAVLSRKGAH
jgi:lipopolysaccharide/colanic/teichoic acid biosynthesis glycosyltransferase